PAASVVRAVLSDQAGIVEAIDTRAIGVAIIELGGGRVRASDSIDHAVGFSHLAGIGTAVEMGQKLGFVNANNDEDAARASVGLRNAYRLNSNSPRSKVSHDRID